MSHPTRDSRREYESVTIEAGVWKPRHTFNATRSMSAGVSVANGTAASSSGRTISSSGGVHSGHPVKHLGRGGGHHSATTTPRQLQAEHEDVSDCSSTTSALTHGSTGKATVAAPVDIRVTSQASAAVPVPLNRKSRSQQSLPPPPEPSMATKPRLERGTKSVGSSSWQCDLAFAASVASSKHAAAGRQPPLNRQDSGVNRPPSRLERETTEQILLRLGEQKRAQMQQAQIAALQKQKSDFAGGAAALDAAAQRAANRRAAAAIPAVPTIEELRASMDALRPKLLLLTRGHEVEDEVCMCCCFVCERRSQLIFLLFFLLLLVDDVCIEWTETSGLVS